MSPKEILALEMQENDSEATTVGGYLIALLRELWREQEGFSGKRPFGNSGWEYDLARPLIVAGVIDGALDSDGYIARCDSGQLANTIAGAINELGRDYK